MYAVKNLVTPGCCDEMRKKSSIFLTMPDSYCETFDNNEKPIWVTRCYFARTGKWEMYRLDSDHPIPKKNQELIEGVAIAHFCPFCGKPVPEIERINTGKRKVFQTYNGDYCDTCGKRVMECKCSYPTEMWRPKREEN